MSSYNQKGNIYAKNIFGSIDENEITINGGASKASFQWNDYVSYKLTSEILLLYQNKNCFNVFTRSMFASQDDWDKFIDLAKSKVSMGKKRS